ncbi:u2 snrnp-specific a protein [Stylonychia lemnae]|uniref:U2 snrnp-specific a protein n=1 Tax=Stylonychia lemnae TaxID=5949 RepID=A0A078AHU1_STYLE|nr:u2 snrnp-specific a protein [Stylonychia lemnae]|eukprot:CDW81072.1 u2 snrnp-specific a protein [Stylonychia lemnae]
MSIKKAILDKNDGNDVEKSEYVNLILDDMSIGDINEEDKQFLEGFKETQFLSLNSTQLKSLQNLPKLIKLERLELSDNKIGAYSDSMLRLVPELYENLRVLKLSNNQIKTFEEITDLSKCEKLESLDLSNNPIVVELGEEYTKKIRELLPKLEILDGFNKEGLEVVSEDESDEDDEDEEGEEGEDDEEGDDEEEEGEDGEEGDDDGEEGEEEMDEEEEGEEQEGIPLEGDQQMVGKKRKASEKVSAGGITADSELDGSGKDATKKRVNVEPTP